ncbi:MAG: rod shape-determining protein MreD [Nitrospirota bacterium]
MRFLIYIIIFILIIPVQTIFMDTISIHGITPEIGLVIVYCIGMFYGEVEGIVIGFYLGVILDIFSGGFWYNFLGKTLIGLLSGLLGKSILNLKLYFNISMIFLFSLIEGVLVYLMLEMLEKDINFFETLKGIIIPQSIYNGVIGGIASWMLFKKKQLNSF